MQCVYNELVLTFIAPPSGPGVGMPAQLPPGMGTPPHAPSEEGGNTPEG